jgi:polygalacturonase
MGLRHTPVTWHRLSVLLLCAFSAAARSEPIRAPVIPDRSFNILDNGAVPDGPTMNTQAIQKTLDACKAAGGGTVHIPPGTFLTAPLTLCSNLNLHLDKGAVLQMTDKLSDFPRSCHDISITGEGTIDGNGGAWWPRYGKAPGADALPHRPFLLVLKNCRRVLVRDILLQNSPMFNLVPQACRDVTIDSVRIQDPARSPNTDGIDPSGWNFLITHCTIDVGDDCIALKPSSRNGDLKPRPDSLSCEDFTITDCTFRHGHGMSIGNPTGGGLRRMTVRDCTFDSTDAGIRMKTQRGKGNIVEDLDYENLTMKNVKVALFITDYYPSIPKNPQDDPAQPVTDATPIFRHIHIANVTADGGAVAGRIIGLAEMPISDILLEDVHISAQKGMQIVNAKGIEFVNSTVTAAAGPAVDAQDADVTGLP